MRHTPELQYCGLTIVLSNPSRMDLSAELLISGLAGSYFNSCLKPVSRFACDIRTLDEGEEWLPGTKVVLLLGAQCMSLLGDFPTGTRLTHMRGSPFDINGITYLLTFLPQDAVDRINYEIKLNPLLKDQSDDDDSPDKESQSTSKNKGATSRTNYRFWLKADVKKAVHLLQHGTSRNSCRYIIRPPSWSFHKWAINQTDRKIFFDIETNPYTDQITCFSVSNSAEEVWCIPCIEWDGTLAYDVALLAGIFRDLVFLFEHNSIVIHNAQFDLFILLWRYGICPPRYDRIEDTMVMHHRCYPEVEKSLGHCISLYTHQPYHKNEASFFPKNNYQDQKLWEYNAKDVETLALVYYSIRNHAAEIGAVESCRQANQCIRVFLLLSFRGIRIDTKKLCKLIDYNNERAVFFEQRVIPKLVGYKLNPRSPDQVETYLYKHLGLKAPMKGSKTGKKQLYSLQIKQDIPALSIFLYLRRLSTESGKLKSKLWHKEFFTGTYNIAGTKSFRLSSRQLFDEWGTNMQNFKGDIKKLVIPYDDYEIWQVDLAGVEAFIVAYLCRRGGNFRELFIHGIKPHVYVALHLFIDHWIELMDDKSVGDLRYVAIKDLHNHSKWAELVAAIKASDSDIPSRRYYYFAKQTCHSANYGIGARSFVMNVLDKSEGEVVLSAREGNRLLSSYHDLFPEIVGDFHSYVEQQLEAKMELRNLFGYPRRFFGQVDHSMLKDAYSWIPQSTGSGIVAAKAAAEIQQRIDTGEVDFMEVWQNNHDSLMGVAPIGRGVDACRIVAEHFNVELTNPYGETFKLRSEYQVGTSWKELKEIKL